MWGTDHNHTLAQVEETQARAIFLFKSLDVSQQGGPMYMDYMKILGPLLANIQASSLKSSLKLPGFVNTLNTKPRGASPQDVPQMR